MEMMVAWTSNLLCQHSSGSSCGHLGSAILDVGSGNGVLPLELARLGFTDVTGARHVPAIRNPCTHDRHVSMTLERISIGMSHLWYPRWRFLSRTLPKGAKWAKPLPWVCRQRLQRGCSRAGAQHRRTQGRRCSALAA